MPFCHLRLKGSRLPDFPIVYAHDPKTIGEHLRKVRLLRRLRQRDVAASLGVRVETVANWEKGRVRPLARHYGAVIRFLGLDPGPTSPSISGRLQSIRRRLGLTQVELATKVGLDEGSIRRWESGSRRPSRWMTARVEAILESLEQGRAVAKLDFYDLTRWRRRPPAGSTPTTLGERIRATRLELGMNQEEAGRLLGVGRATIYRWERGSVPVPASRMAAIRRFVGRDGRQLG